MRDLEAGTTGLVSADPNGFVGSGGSAFTSFSAHGRYVAFSSDANNLVADDTNGTTDVFVRDLQLGTTIRVSVDSAGNQANNYSYSGSISADGRHVAFTSSASNLVAGDTNGFIDVYVRDLQLGTTTRVSVDSSGDEANGDSNFLELPSISADGRYVAFSSEASNLVAGDTNGVSDIFVRDLHLGTTTRVSVGSVGGQANGGSFEASISADGRYVAFSSDASNLVAGDTNSVEDVFVFDLQRGTTTRVGVAPSGGQANNESFLPSISADGRHIAFNSVASNLVADDTNGDVDTFVADGQVLGWWVA
ncbi:Tol biopolymer transport system component [Sinorhizobium kostiense]|uniref:Tol biopolymer transport system component n=1 Tax=Sinorhizobium kostiense TaxID=76747 RepID=A0ABS4QYV2_9HYPH|nr:PD40 domain-containing protein [Sinorhizobium kostiense]MBP2235259.1 Tol biopolymer transport system component [Sinorhizobium kostiense]